MKSIRKVVFGIMTAATVCAFVSCKSQGEKLAEETHALKIRAEKAMENGNMDEYQKLSEDIVNLSEQVEKLSETEQAKYLKAFSSLDK